MRVGTRLLSLGLLVGMAAAGVALAADDQEKARERFEKGVANQRQAALLEEQLETVTDPKDLAKLTKQRDRAYRRAIKEFSGATAKDPSLGQAYEGLAEVLGRTGKHAEAVEARDRALALDPGDLGKLERRAQALLAADRPLDARRDYETLAEQDAERAAELFLTMKRWVIAKRASAGDLSIEGMAELERWIKRQEVQAGNYDLEPSGE